MFLKKPWYLCLVMCLGLMFGCGQSDDDDSSSTPFGESPDPNSPTPKPDIPPLGPQPTPLAQVTPSSCPQDVVKQDVSGGMFSVYENEDGDIVFMATLAYEPDQAEPYVSETCHFSIHTDYISEPYYGGVNYWEQGIYLYPSPDSHSTAAQWELIFVVPAQAYYNNCDDDWEVCRQQYYAQVYYPRL